MLRIYLFLILGVVPLSAQSSFNNDAGKVTPDQAPKLIPAQPPANAVMTPGVNAPPPGTPPPPPPMPAEPVPLPRIAQFVVSPGTVREGLTEKDAVKATVTLTAPAIKDFVCHVVSTDPKKVVVGNIVVPKGQQTQDAVVSVIWEHVRYNGQVQLKAYDEENPETLLRARLYLRKKIQ